MQDKMSREIEAAIVQYRNKTLERSPGLSLKESLEEKIMQITSKARESAGAIVETSLGFDNTALIMAKIGARGSLLNAIQMAAMVGQQAVRSKRLSRGYRGRTLPHFKRGDLGAAARGFVFGSFKTGLSPDGILPPLDGRPRVAGQHGHQDRKVRLHAAQADKRPAGHGGDARPVGSRFARRDSAVQVRRRRDGPDEGEREDGG